MLFLINLLYAHWFISFLLYPCFFYISILFHVTRWSNRAIFYYSCTATYRWSTIRHVYPFLNSGILLLEQILESFVYSSKEVPDFASIMIHLTRMVMIRYCEQVILSACAFILCLVLLCSSKTTHDFRCSDFSTTATPQKINLN